VNVGEILRVNKKPKFRPAVIIDNIDSGSTTKVVQELGGKTLYSGGQKTWAMGMRVTDDNEDGKDVVGPLTPEPVRPANMVDGKGSYVGRSKPQYEDRDSDGFANVLSWGVSNEAKNAASNTIKINEALSATAQNGKVLIFPSGVYLVDDTLHFPRGSRVVGVLWSQIMATGVRFSDPNRPHVLAM
jgi:glucan 1,3-beta-glucosidase